MLAVSDIALTVSTVAPLSFALGLAVGFVLSNRYRIIRRNGEGKP